jgi:hypothetical protein
LKVNLNKMKFLIKNLFFLHLFHALQVTNLTFHLKFKIQIKSSN